MAKIKLADGVGRLNDRYNADLTYQQLYMFGVQRRIPVERDETGRFWLIDEADLPRIARILGLVVAKPKPKPVAKPSTKLRTVIKPSTTRSRAA